MAVINQVVCAEIDPSDKSQYTVDQNYFPVQASKQIGTHAQAFGPGIKDMECNPHRGHGIDEFLAQVGRTIAIDRQINPHATLGGFDDKPLQLIAHGILKNNKSFQHHAAFGLAYRIERSEEHTSELQSLMRTSYAVFCVQKKIK